MSFAHLHNHTEYSMLDGISRIPDMVRRTGELGMDATAITDHGAFHGVIDFYSECKDAGIKPIIGCEVYVAHQSRLIKNQTEKSPNHLVLLAKDNTGYRNLMQLVTRSNTEGFYNRPRVDKKLLTEFNQGLVCLSGCPSAEIPKLLADGKYDEARSTASWYQEVFGDSYFLEIQSHRHIEQLPRINQGLLVLREELKIPLVATNDTHYVNQADASLHDIYLCIQTGTNLQDEKRLRMEDDSYHIKSPQEMQELLRSLLPSDLLSEAMDNTGQIAAACNVSLDFGQTHLPKYECPDGMSADAYLEQLCEEGFRRCYPNPSAEAIERLRYELEVVRHTRFANYFLVVWDIIKFVRERNILFGVRGSAAASVVLHCLGITDIEPLQYRLVFERFLNLERKEMPDIDMDFQDNRRDEVLNYVVNKYGNEQVAQIITFGTFGAKTALKDTGRALDMSYGATETISKMVSPRAKNLTDALETSSEMAAAYRNDEKVRTLIDNARQLEGLVHHVGTHAAGVLISEEPLTHTVPLQRPPKGDENSPVLMTQFSMDPVAKLGLLKMDFLGLTSLSILDRAIKLVERHQGLEIDLQQIPLDDEATFDLLSSGNTTDVFQLESSGMQRYIRELKPTTITDIAAMIALYRPGPMENIDRFIAGKHRRINVSYPHQSFKEMLDETYGVIVYQDQVLLILQQFAGYTLGAADIVRKAMGKKIPALMAQERDNFVTGATSKGYDESLATEIFDLIEPFAGYAFNKAHSVSYALISYWTAYFKTHHTACYMAAVLNSRLGNPARTASSMNECFRLGITVELPDINRSETGFSIDPDEDGKPRIRSGLSAIKTVSETVVSPIVSDRRENGPYESIDQFCSRAGAAGLNRRTLENLVKAGAFDELADRGPLLAALDQMTGIIQRESKTRDQGQSNLFGTSEVQDIQHVRLDGPQATEPDKIAWEKDLLGAALSKNQIIELSKSELHGATIVLDEMDGDPVTIVGIVSAVNQGTKRDGDKFYSVDLDMIGGTASVTVWPEALTKTREVWQVGNAVRVLGKLQDREEKPTVICEDAWEHATDGSEPAYPTGLPEPAPQAPKKTWSPSDMDDVVTEPQVASEDSSASETRRAAQEMMERIRSDSYRLVTLTVSSTDQPDEDVKLLREAVGLLLDHPGTDAVDLQINTPGKRVLMELPTVSTHYSETMKEQIEELLGPGAVKLQTAQAEQPVAAD